ncbi:MAG: hypothetical protein ABW185_28585 [Sedimenticola sp.]
MSDYNENFEDESMYMFKNKLHTHLRNVAITSSSGSKPAKIYSKATSKAAIDEVASTQLRSNSKMHLLYDCAEHLRGKIKSCNCLSWEFSGSVDLPITDFLPAELVMFVKWLIHGPKTSQSATRGTEMNRSANILTQHILQHFKTDRQAAYTSEKSGNFYNSVETPLAVGMSLQSHHQHRSKNDIDILNAASVGVSYNRVNDMTTQIANNTIKSMNDFNGTYVPPLVLKGVPIRASADNIDKKVDTPDGQNSFHGSAMSVYQTVKPGVNVETVREKLTIKSSLKTDYLKDVPETVIEVLLCRVEGNPKPKTSPTYEHYTIGEHRDELINAQSNDLTWLVARFMHRSEMPKLIQTPPETSESEIIPVWRAYNSLISTKEPITSTANHKCECP